MQLNLLKDGGSYEIFTHFGMVRKVQECLMDLICEPRIALFTLEQELPDDVLSGQHLSED